MGLCRCHVCLRFRNNVLESRNVFILIQVFIFRDFFPRQINRRLFIHNGRLCSLLLLIWEWFKVVLRYHSLLFRIKLRRLLVALLFRRIKWCTVRWEIILISTSSSPIGEAYKDSGWTSSASNSCRLVSFTINLWLLRYWASRAVSVVASTIGSVGRTGSVLACMYCW